MYCCVKATHESNRTQQNTVEICSGITHGAVLKSELYTHRIQTQIINISSDE